MAKRWKKQDETYLRRYAGIRTVRELAERFKTDPGTVQAKLDELDVEAKDRYEPARLEGDPRLETFEKGLQALHAGKWRPAKKHFEAMIAIGEPADFVRRARQFLRVCDEKLAGEPEPVEDPYLAAVVARNRGDFDEALDLCARGGRRSKDERFAYLAASVFARQGELEDAAQYLRTAIELNAKNRVHALHDDDFAPLREHEEHGELFR